jgi:hypothetical protein
MAIEHRRVWWGSEDCGSGNDGYIYHGCTCHHCEVSKNRVRENEFFNDRARRGHSKPTFIVGFGPDSFRQKFIDKGLQIR